MITELLLLSHGPTRAMRSASFPADEPLDPPLPRLSERLAKKGRIDRALMGPEQRTRETAEALQLPISFAVDPVLRDCDYGRWRGKRFDEVQSEEPVAMTSWIQSVEAASHGGESISQLLKRISEWIDGQGHLGGRVLAVTHPSVVRAAMVRILEAPPETFWRVDVSPFCLADFRGNNGRWSLRSLSCQENEGRQINGDNE